VTTTGREPAPSGSPAARRPAVAVRGLTKRFGPRAAFEELTFDVAWGEVFGFLGPNGAGKTTTVRVLCTLLPPTSGSAEVAGVPLAPGNEAEIRRRVSVVTEAPGLYLKLSVRDNLEFYAGLYGLAPRLARERIEDCAAAVGIGDRLGDPAGSLSRGLLQRAGLARALLADPEVLFLDEPTAGLDPAAAVGVRELVAALRSRGTTVFLTTHRLDEAERLCDRVAILNTRLVTVGTPAELRARRSGRALEVRLLEPLGDPGAVFGAVAGMQRWENGHGTGVYVVEVDDPERGAAGVARAVVGAGASLVRLGGVETSLEDVYLDLLEEGGR
jgi:ABC-2 type transport system ATP-binding protein